MGGLGVSREFTGLHVGRALRTASTSTPRRPSRKSLSEGMENRLPAWQVLATPNPFNWVLEKGLTLFCYCHKCSKTYEHDDEQFEQLA